MGRNSHGLRKLSADLIDKASDETASQVVRLMLAFVGTAAFCLLSLLSPDIGLLTSNEKLTVPGAGPVSFFGFMLLGPAILIVLRIYLQIYVEHSARLDRIAQRMPVVRAPTLAPLKNPLIRGFSALTFYLLLPVTMLSFALKAAVFPIWGSGLLCVAAAIVASHAMLPLRKVSWPARALGSVGVAILAGLVILSFGPVRRPFDLYRANLSAASLQGYDLRGAKLDFADLTDAILSGANLSGAELENANLIGADLSKANLGSAHLQAARFGRVTNLVGADLSKADLSGTDLRDANLHGADLRGANLNGAILEGTKLSGADLRGANLQAARLSGADLRGADLDLDDLHGADLRGAILGGANLSGANLSGGANLLAAKLDLADLRGADLRGANLEEADLPGAKLGLADLRGADLESANLIGAELDGQQQLNGACGVNAKLPPGLTLKPCPRT
jgi:uncharacterized protein YjbI with pentapeptide repeats